MARFTKRFENKEFVYYEISNAIKSTFISFDFDPSEIQMQFDFIIDEISQSENLTFEKLEMLTSIKEGTELQFFAMQHDIEHENGKSLSIYLTLPIYDKNTIYIVITASTVEILKKALPILEDGLTLKEISKPNDKTIGVETPNLEEEFNLKEISKPNSEVNEIDTPVIVDKNKNDSQIGYIYAKKLFKRKFGPIRMYKEDLEFIIKLFKEHYKFCRIRIDDKIKDELGIEGVKTEIKKDWVTNIFIYGSDSRLGDNLDLNLGCNGANIIVYDEKDVKSMGVFHQVESRLSKKENKILKLVNSFKGFILICIVLLLIITNIIFGNYLYGEENSFIINLFLLVISIFNVISLALARNRYSLIYLFYSNEKKHFLVQNRDIIVAIIGTFVGTILGTLLIGHL
jgi:hypothetical protein